MKERDGLVDRMIARAIRKRTILVTTAHDDEGTFWSEHARLPRDLPADLAAIDAALWQEAAKPCGHVRRKVGAGEIGEVAVEVWRCDECGDDLVTDQREAVVPEPYDGPIVEEALVLSADEVALLQQQIVDLAGPERELNLILDGLLNGLPEPTGTRPE